MWLKCLSRKSSNRTRLVVHYSVISCQRGSWTLAIVPIGQLAFGIIFPRSEEGYCHQLLWETARRLTAMPKENTVWLKSLLKWRCSQRWHNTKAKGTRREGQQVSFTELWAVEQGNQDRGESSASRMRSSCSTYFEDRGRELDTKRPLQQDLNRSRGVRIHGRPLASARSFSVALH